MSIRYLLWELYICISSHKAGLLVLRDDVGLVCFLWQKMQSSCKHQCTGYICISCSGAVCQYILTSGYERSNQVTIWCFFVFFFLSVCISVRLPLAKCMEKSSLLFSQEIPPHPWGKTGREGVKEQQATSASDTPLQAGISYFSFILLCILSQVWLGTVSILYLVDAFKKA